MDTNLSYIAERLTELTAIPSPTGYTKHATDYLVETLTGLGYTPEVSNKGNVLVELGGQGKPLVLASHVDTLGAMVRSVKDNGRLRPRRSAATSGARPTARTAPSTRTMAEPTRAWSSTPSPPPMSRTRR